MIDKPVTDFCHLLLEPIQLTEIKIQLRVLESSDHSFYLQLYQNHQLMRYIKEPLTLSETEKYFATCLKQLKNHPPKNINYIIKSEQKLLGILGFKSMAEHVVEFGILIDLPFQNLGWSKKIKRSLYSHLFNQYEVESIVCYCDENNATANHINQTLGFQLTEHKYQPRFKRVVKKWVCTKSIFQNILEANYREIT